MFCVYGRYIIYECIERCVRCIIVVCNFHGNDIAGGKEAEGV